MSKLDQFTRKAFNYLFHIVLSLMLIDWAVKLPGDFVGVGIYEIVFLLLGCVCLVRLYFEKGKVFQHIVSVIRASKWSIIAIAVYLFFGAATLFYAQTPSYAITKYIVVVQMLFFGMCLFYYMPVHKDGPGAALKKIYLNIGISAVISAIWALGKYFLFSGAKFPAIISPVIDYNQYSTILLIGWICAATYISRMTASTTKKYALLAAFSSLLLPMALVSGSRRSYVLGYLIAAAILVLVVIISIKKLIKGYERKMLCSMISTLLICVFCVAFTSGMLINTVDTMSSLPSTEVAPPNSDSYEPESSQDRLDSGNGLGKREVIWGIAIKEIQNFNIVEFIIGKGASHSSDIYDDLTDPAVKSLHNSYGYDETSQAEKNWMNPHNLFLQDMLDGGLLLLLAQLAIIFTAAFYVLRVMRADFVNGIALAMIYGILFATLLLSIARGMVSNKFFWIAIMLQTSECYNLKTASNS